MRDTRRLNLGAGGRLSCLDGLRGLLATYVLLNHMAPLLALPGWAEPARSGLLHGQAAVDVFFILSGMVIVRSLASHDGAVAFLRARAWRIYPVYLAVLVLAVAAQALPSGLGQMLWAAPEAADLLSGGWPADAWARLAAHLTMAHGLFPAGVLPHVWIAFLGSAWSLSTEWQFYVLVAVLGGTVRRVWPLAALFLALAAAGAAWHAAAPEAWQFSRAFLPNKAAYFSLGIASAGVASGTADGAGRRRYLAVLAATLAFGAHGGQPDKLLPPLVWTLCLAAQLGWAPARPLAWLLGQPALLWLGAVSFPLYLVNEPVQKLLALAALPWAAGDGRLFDALFAPAAVVLPLLAARLLHTRVELPGVRLGRERAEPVPSLSAG